MNALPWIALAFVVLCVAAEVEQWRRDKHNRKRGL